MVTPAKVWEAPASECASAACLADALAVPLPIACALERRGFEAPEPARRYLDPRLQDLGDPFALPAMMTAVARIAKAIETREKILVFGDYDADGVTATALMVTVLSRLGAMVEPFLPRRVEDGYGLGPDVLQRALGQSQPGLVITVDCGTGSAEAVQLARERGIDVVVTDHHEPGATLAPAVAVINPKLGAPPAMRNLAGVGVAFKLCQALVRRMDAVAAVDPLNYLDFVAVGTIADIVPLLEENRILARHGLAWLNQRGALGFQSLVAAAGVKGRLDAYHVGYLLGPRLNAAGRLGDAHAALELLLSDHLPRARSLAAQLDAANRERQEVESAIVREAEAQLSAAFDPQAHYGLVVAHRDWHTGVIGIVASRLSARFQRPVIVISVDAEGRARGSGRSIPGFDLLESLGQCAEALHKFGGHTMAAGLELDASRLEDFSRRFNQVAADRLRHTDLRPRQPIDAWIELAEADETLLAAQERMSPFGHGNPAPVWAARGVRVVGTPRVVGQKHLSLRLAVGRVEREAIAFGMGSRNVPSGFLDVAFHLQMNRYGGRETLQLNVQDWRAQSAAAAAPARELVRE